MWTRATALAILMLCTLVGCATRNDHIRIVDDGSLLLNGKPIAAEQLEQSLRTEEVTIEADSRAPHSDVIRVLNQVQQQTRRVNLVVRPPR